MVEKCIHIVQGTQWKVKVFLPLPPVLLLKSYQCQQFPVYPSRKIQCIYKHMAWHILKP